MGKTSELLSLLRTGNSDAARRLIAKLRKSGKKKALTKELNVPDDNGQTVIHFCASQNFVEFLQDLADLGASIDLADNKGYTPLHLAAVSGRTSAVTALINMGADPNISSRTGDTALHLACHGGHATSVEALVSENANCTMLNVSGHTPLDLACQSGHAQVVSLLLRSGQFSTSYLQRSDMPHTALMLAAKQGHNECIGLLVKHGFDVNRKLPGGNSGTALHEAALYGRVDTVRYLLQCGVDLQQTNAQGLTALEVVNMYTDPRTASIMKQVLQDALAQQARTRIAQQHAGQQPPPPAPTQHTPPSTRHQPAGFSYFSHPGQTQPAMQRQMSGESPHSPQLHRQHHVPGHSHQPPTQPYRQSSHAHQPVGQSHQQMNHSHQSAGQSYHHVGQSHQPTGQSAQHSGHSYSGHHAQPSGPAYQHQQQQSAAYPATSSHGVSRSARPELQPQLPKQVQTHAGEPHTAQPSPPQTASHVQHIYPKPGTPEAMHKAPGMGGDLASIIAARAASRKPIVTSPTRKEFGDVDDERYSRSMTVGGESAVHEARAVALRRRSSLSDRSSGSPEHSDVHNPPTLPRRTQAGPPAFKPIPPPDDPRTVRQGQTSELLGGYVAEGSASDPPLHRHSHGKSVAAGSSETMAATTGQRQHPRRPQPRAPSPTVENELLAKLMHRQNKITEAEQAPPEQPPQAQVEEEEEREEEQQEEVILHQKPPPPPLRKTPSLNTQPVPQPTPAPTPDTEGTQLVARQRKSKPPPPKPKETEAEMTPWQQELAARKARLADNEPDPEPEPEPIAAEDHVQEKAQQPVPAPKPKRKSPPSVPAFPHEQPPPPVVRAPPSVPAFPHEQPPVVKVPPPVPSPPQEQPVLPIVKPPVLSPEVELSKPAEGPVVATVGELAGTSSVGQVAAAVPAEVSTLAASSTDQLSRSTSLSSLTTTTGTGSPQLHHMEHMPIAEWLTGYKLGDYTPVLEASGYETTELLVGISHDELQEMGINKIGHRKKLISALSNWPQREPFFQSKPESVSLWLSVLRMSQYEQTMLEAGYDDIDFVCDITLDDLHDIGISKGGHVKRLLRGIGELTELMKSGLPFPSPTGVAQFQSLEAPAAPLAPAPLARTPSPPTAMPPTSVVPSAHPPSTTLEDTILPPPQNWTGETSESPERVNFGRMKGLLERKMGVNRVLEDSNEGSPRESCSPPPEDHATLPPAVPRREPAAPIVAPRLDGQIHAEREQVGDPYQLPPQLPPKKSRKPSPAPRVSLGGTGAGEDELDGNVGKKFSVGDITAALGESDDTRQGSATAGQEFDQLSAVLQDFTPETGQTKSADDAEPEPDQLLADIDDMLADLTTHLDFMIPGPTS